MTFASFSTVIAVFENLLANCMDNFGWSVLDDGHGEAYLPLRDYDQDTVLLELNWSHTTQAEVPVTIPIK